MNKTGIEEIHKFGGRVVLRLNEPVMIWGARYGRYCRRKEPESRNRHHGPHELYL